MIFERVGVSTRITIVMCVLVLVTAATSAGLIFSYLNDQLVESKRLELVRETDLQGAQFVNLIEALKRDVRVLTMAPLIPRIIRAHENNGIDPRDGSKLEVLRGRLGIILTELLRNQESYLQARFIGVADGGREYVRVERLSEGADIRVIPESELQKKGEASYFVEAMRRPPGELYLSPINLNREHGEIAVPHTPVLRAMMPVHGSDDSPFGMIIINFAVQKSLDSIGRVSNPTHNYYVANAENAYLIHPESGRNFEFEWGALRRATDDFPDLVDSGAGERSHAGSHTHALASQAESVKERVINIRRVIYGDEDSAEWLSIIATSSFDDITAVATLVAREVLLIILALVIFAAGIGAWLARMTTKPIDTLAATVREMNVDDGEFEIPSSLTAEARELALALQSAFATARERAEALEAKNGELERFAYIASHDLQEPVRTITSFIEILNKDFAESLPPGAEQSMRFITESCTRMRELIHGLLEYSRLGVNATPEAVDLNETLIDIVQDLHAAIDAKAAQIEIGPLPTLNLYAVEVRMLFQNLMSNALKFTNPDTPPRITIEANQEDFGWRFTVTDNGIGIAEKDREKAFLMFQRLHNRKDYEGTGIGLAHCQKIAGMHNGAIRIESAPSGGTQFQILLKPF